MFVDFKRLHLVLILLLGVSIAPGCQSCQESSTPPPPAQSGAPAAPKPATDQGTDQGQGAGEQAPVDDEVDEDALVLLAEGEPEDGTAPLSVRFIVESLIEDEMNNPQYKWDFGDGSPVSTEASPTHVYEKPGSYTATIRIVDGKGELGWDEVDIEVEEP